MPVGDDKVFCFHDFTLDLRRGCLCRADHDIELRPKSFALLRYLVENAGRLASKDELVGAVWGDVAVTDASLARCVSDVRLALQDQSQRIIKTVPRRGYLLAAQVSEAANESITPAKRPEKRHSHGIRANLGSSPSWRASWLGLAFAAGRDQEDLREATTFCHKQGREIIEQHHGYVARNSGDGLLAFFGYPEAREQDAENAVRAALALRGLTEKLRTKLETKLQVCIGIASGVVAVGDEFTAGKPIERTIIGEALILQRVCKPRQSQVRS